MMKYTEHSFCDKSKSLEKKQTFLSKIESDSNKGLHTVSIRRYRVIFYTLIF